MKFDSFYNLAPDNFINFETWADPEGRGRGPNPLENRNAIWLSGFPEKSLNYKASIRCWAIIGTPAKRQINGVSLVGR